MLLSLHIRNFVIVEKLDISFSEGFTVFSGETGAGKSILIDALSLTLGQRGDAHMVREGAQKADISAIFETSEKVTQWLSHQDIDSNELVLRRTLDNQGKSKAFINGTPATLTQLKELSEMLIDIHGQHAHQLLLKPNAQRTMLDAQGGHAALVKQVQQAWQLWQKAQENMDNAITNLEQQEHIRERLEWQLSELKQLNPGKEEWAQIDSDYNRLAHASALMEGVAQTLNTLDNDQQSICSELSHACARISQLANKDSQLASIYETLESARITCVEAASDLNAYLNRLDLDPSRLEQTEQRMRSMFDLAKKFKIEPENLYIHKLYLQEELDKINQTVDIDALKKQVEIEQQNYFTVAKQLTHARQQAADSLAKNVTQAMQTLAMQGGKFEIELQDIKPSAYGLENIQFNVAGHAGTTPRALNKVASGGELARISLALSVMSNQAHQVPTLIFDEVDTGIGGAVAEVVGQLLRQLGKTHQVLCVTHLPQVAACGHQHFQVSKQQKDGHTISQIKPLTIEGRTQEIARMLGGVNITETSLDHAREMLSHATE